MSNVRIESTELEKLDDLNFEDFGNHQLLQIRENSKNIVQVYPHNVLTGLERSEDVKRFDGLYYCVSFHDNGFTPKCIIGKAYDEELLMRVLRVILKE